MKNFPKKVILFFFIAIITPALSFKEISAREKCRKPDAAFLSLSAESLVNDRINSRISESAVSSLKALEDRIGRTFLLSDLESDRKIRCSDVRCAVELCRAKGVDYLVSVSVSRRSAEQLKDYDSYLMQKNTGVVYSFSLRVTDISSGKAQQIFSAKNINSGNVGIYSKKIQESLLGYFRKIKTCDENEAKDDNTFFSITGLSVSGVLLKPFGNYSDTAESGYGANVRIISDVKSIEALSLSFEISAAYLSPAGENINSDYLLSPHLFAGYSYSVTDSFSITPFAGPGYVFQFINGRSRGDGKDRGEIYYNPSVSCGLEFSYSISQNSAILFSPAFTYFFGRDGSGSYAGISAGYRQNF